MMSLRFLCQFVTYPRQVGSIIPTSSFTVKNILDQSNIQSAKVVVELGPGTGVFTKEIIKRISPEASFICIELNKGFRPHLDHLFEDRKGSHLFYRSAEDMKDILKELNHSYVDTIISGLPFNSLSPSLSNKILKSATESMHKESEFLGITYFRKCQYLFDGFFSHQQWRRNLWNIPPVYCMRMNK